MMEVAITGHVGIVPTLQRADTGKSWCRFTIGIGNDPDAFEWVECRAFGAKAEQIAALELERDATAYVEGRAELKRWTTSDGSERARLLVVASRVEPLAQIGRRRPAKPKATARAGVAI